MKQILTAALLLVVFVVPALGKTQKEVFNVKCTSLWPAVKDVLRNSGKYGIIGIDNTEMTASYNIGGFLGGKRINSLVLNPQGDNCELQIQTSFSGFAHDDAGDFKKRVREALTKEPVRPASQPVQSAVPAQPASAPVQTAQPVQPVSQPVPSAESAQPVSQPAQTVQPSGSTAQSLQSGQPIQPTSQPAQTLQPENLNALTPSSVPQTPVATPEKALEEPPK